MTANSDRDLIHAVKELNQTVISLRTLLSDEYPKRTEIERNFQSRLDARKHISRMVIVALVTVVGCYIMSVGVYASCFVGEESPSVCSLVPGYEERINRRNEINKKDQQFEQRIRRLEAQLGRKGAK